MKAGIDFFPLDVHLDDKWKLIEAQFGLKGFAVVVKLFQKIYGEFGYYCEWNDDIALLFAQSVGVADGNVVSDIVNASVKRGIFDRAMFEKYAILTSMGVQKRYFDAVKRRKEITVTMEYTLFDVAHFLKDVNIIWKNVNINGENVNTFQQSKVEKSRVEKSMYNSASNDAKPKGGRHTFAKPSVEEIRFYCIERHNSVDAQRFFDFYESKGWLVGKSPMKDWKACVRTWEKYEQKGVSPKSIKRCLIGGMDLERRHYTDEEIHALFTPLDDDEEE